MRRELRAVIAPAYDGMKIKTYARTVMKISSTLLNKMKYSQGIFKNNKQVLVIERVSAGDQLLFLLPEGVLSENVLPEKGELDIRYEDEDLLILNKGSGMAVHPNKGHEFGTVANYLAGYYKKNGMEASCHLVNRLDVGTSGLMVVAKHAYAQERLAAQMENGTFARNYLAMVHGCFDEKEGRIEAPIARPDAATIKRAVDPRGKYAATNYMVLKSAKDASLLRLWLDTGRTHQIRVHMSHLGHPLYGDFLYGREEKAISHTALHSCYLSLEHPVTGRRMYWCSAPPPDFQALISDCFFESESDR